MPLYDYLCRKCGPFRDWRPMSRSNAPAPCPACGKAGGRAMSLPNMNLLSGTERQAHHRNEKSADSPEVVQSIGDRGHHGHEHGKGKLKRSRHPWMIGH